MTKPSAVLNKHQKKVNESDDDGGLQHCEISKNNCATCFGQWEDDDDAVEWLCYTCGVWSHTECLEKCDDASIYICAFCQTCFT